MPTMKWPIRVALNEYGGVAELLLYSHVRVRLGSPWGCLADALGILRQV